MKIFFYWLLDMLFPRRCMLCRKFLTEKETDICRECTIHMDSYPFGFFNRPPSGKNKARFLDSFTAVWYYEGDVRRSILRYKFNKAVYLAPKFGKMVAMKLLQEGPEQFDILTWVPVSSLRRFKRGYDQCELLAKYVGSELGIPCVRVLKKVRNNPPQSGLRSADQRKANVLGAYRLCRKADVYGKRIVLLDDIFTTGATMDECARTLLTAGAKEVHGAAIAAAHYHKFSSR
jgi:competence protein ComFC